MSRVSVGRVGLGQRESMDMTGFHCAPAPRMLGAYHETRSGVMPATELQSAACVAPSLEP